MWVEVHPCLLQILHRNTGNTPQKNAILPSVMCKSPGFKGMHSLESSAPKAWPFLNTCPCNLASVICLKPQCLAAGGWSHGCIWSLVPTLFPMAQTSLMVRNTGELLKVSASHKKPQQKQFRQVST